MTSEARKNRCLAFGKMLRKNPRNKLTSAQIEEKVDKCMRAPAKRRRAKSP